VTVYLTIIYTIVINNINASNIKCFGRHETFVIVIYLVSPKIIYGSYAKISNSVAKPAHMRDSATSGSAGLPIDASF